MNNKLYKIAIFSDTHGSLKEIPFFNDLNEYDYFIYLGDGYEEIEKWSNKNNLSDRLMAVTGNCDFAPHIPRQKTFDIGGVKIFITHGDLYYVKRDYKNIFNKAKELKVNAVMFGHTHYADHHIIDDIHIFNPGSVYPRGRNFCSIGYMEIQNKKIKLLDHLSF